MLCSVPTLDELGATMAMSATRGSTKRTLVVGVSSSIVILLLVTLVIRQSIMREETYLLPAEFRGPVIVLYQHSGGASPEYEDGRLIYRIPESGVLPVNWREASFRPQYYFVSRDGNRLRIPLDNGSFCNGDSPVTTVVVCNMPYLVASSRDKPVPPYRGFIVTSLNDRDKQIASYHALVAQHIR